MTFPTISGTVDPSVANAVMRMKMKASGRDAAMRRVQAIRRGRFREVWPDLFSEDYPEIMVANFVDAVARDMAATLAALPSLACSAGAMRTDADQQRAIRRNRIGANYWRESNLATHMKWGADQYLSYGFLPLHVEVDYDCDCPIIQVIDPQGCYFELDRRMRTQRFARVWYQDRHELAAQFPELRAVILRDSDGPFDREVEPGTKTQVVQYVDTTRQMLYLPDVKGTVLSSFEHGLTDEYGEPQCPVVICLRPGVEKDPRGAFDDVLWVQLARTALVALTLEAGDKAVRAPIAVPTDVTDFPEGPDALIPTDHPEGFQRLNLQVPPAVFEVAAGLQQEMQQGAGFPQSRFGIGPSGGSTGKGISALEGGYDAQGRLGQEVVGDGLRRATEMCFRFDALMFAGKKKTIAGTMSSESYQFTYDPAELAQQQVRCEISYGYSAGLNPQSAMVTLLQLLGASVISLKTFRDNLPFDVDSEHEQSMRDQEEMEQAIRQGMAAAVTEVGQMMVQGRPDLALQLMQAAQQVIDGRQDGKPLAGLVVEAFQAMQPQPQPDQGGVPGQPGAPGPGGPGPGDALDGVNPNGLPMGVAAGQAQMGPGGRPSIMDLAASFTNRGTPNLQAGIRRRIPTG